MSLAENAYDVIMTSPLVQFFQNVNFSSSYKGLSAHQMCFIWVKESKVTEGGGIPPQVENVLNRPGEIGLSIFRIS